MPSEPQAKRAELKDTIFEIGHALAGLDPGALAELRRMSLDGELPGAPYFWRLASRHGFGVGKRQETWARVVQIMAILTERGTPQSKPSPNQLPTEENGWRGFGHALCDGGDISWGIGEAEPKPMLSELRFARLLAARGPMRAELIERAARALAAKKPPGAGIDCTGLARLLLDPQNPNHARKLARDYYARLDRARRDEEKATENSATGAAA